MAAFHINGPITTFLRDLALNPMLLSRGDPDEVTRLCKIAGQNPEPVLRNTLVQHIRRAHRLGRDTLIASLCRPQDLRFCPACLAEDDAPAAAAGQDGAIHRRERLIWRLKRVRCCAVHALPLICRDRPDGADGRGVFAESVPETTAMLEHMVRSTAPCPGSPPSRLYRRQGGRPLWPGLAGRPAARAGHPDHGTVGRFPGVRSAYPFRGSDRQGTGYGFSLRMEICIQRSRRHLPCIPYPAGRFRSDAIGGSKRLKR